MATKTVRKLQKGGGAGRGGDPRDFGFSASAAQASRSSSAPQSSPRPQQRDQAKAQQFVESQGGDDRTAAAIAQSPAVQQGIAAMLGGGDKRTFAQTPMFNAAGDVVGSYTGQRELPMTPFMIDETIGLPQNLLPPPRPAPQAPQGLFGRQAPGAFAFSETASMRPFDMFEDPLMVPGVESIAPYDAAMPTPVPTTTVPTVGTAPVVSREIAPQPILNPSAIPGIFAAPRMGQPSISVPTTTVGMMDQPPSRSPLMALRPASMDAAPNAMTQTAPLPAPPPTPVLSSRTSDVADPAMGGLGLMGLATNLISSLAGNGGPSRTAPQMRPSIMQVERGEGDDRRMEMFATRDIPRFGISTGDTTTVPEYSPFSLRGLTSTDPGNVMRNIRGAERQMRDMPMGSDNEPAPVQPIAQPVTPPIDTSAMPTERPAWWPSYLPWPPAPRTAAPMPTYTPPPVAPAMPSRQYSTSYSNLQNAISGAGNPLMMGIGGMIRRP